MPTAPNNPPPSPPAPAATPLLHRLIRFCLEQKLIVALLVLFIIVWGVIVAPFDWQIPWLDRRPVAVDAIPDLGENQQIVFTEWMGRSPQDVQDQITYPLTTALLGVPGVKTIRATSMFGFSSIFIIFDDRTEFYWSRARILEKLNSLPAGLLPAGVQPALGPDATAMGQVFWYTLEGRDPDGRPVGGWDLHELRSIQDWQVRYGLLAAEGISEVASVGGFVREYQVDVDPVALRAHNVTLEQVFAAVRDSNLDVGARTIEINRVEYLIRGLGFIRSLSDIENAVVRAEEFTPIRVKDVARVALGPALRTGALDKEGAEAVGAVVVVRHGYNPLQAIHNVKAQIDRLAPGLPARAVIDWRKTHRLEVEEFAHRQGFTAFAADAPRLNDEGWLRWLRATPREQWPVWVTTSQVTIVPFYDRTGLIYETLGTLNKAIIEQILVTILVVLVMVLHLRMSVLISAMLPLAVLAAFIAMKQFGVEANVVALAGIAIAVGTIVDMGIIVTENLLKHLDEASPEESRLEVVYRAVTEVGSAVLTAISTTVISFLPVFFMTGMEGKLFKPLAFTKTFVLVASVVIALLVIPAAAHLMMARRRQAKPQELPGWWRWGGTVLAVAIVGLVLARNWLPLGPERGFIRNLIFVVVIVGGPLVLFRLFEKWYGPILRWCLNYKAVFLALPVGLVLLGANVWRGMGREFMPALDEGAFLYMPSALPHGSIGEALDYLQKQNIAIRAVPEVEAVVGKIGRVESALDPAPIGMVETVITYKPKYRRDENGKIHRQWREHIETPDDIWNEIVKAAAIPGATGVSKLQPIETRRVMLQSGIRARMAVEIKGDNLETIEALGLQIERYLKAGHVPGVNPATVTADRIVGKPYLEIELDREALARYGLRVADVQDVIEVAIGGKPVTVTVEGRERYPVRVRYQRELRGDPDELGRVLVATMEGAQIPLSHVANIRYVRGPEAIKTENTFLVGYVLFDKDATAAEVDVVEAVDKFLRERIASGEIAWPAGYTFSFAGDYENQLRAQRTLLLVVPLALFIIFMLLYLQFRAVWRAGVVFIGIAVAWAGAFCMIWLYSQPWFANFAVFGVNLRELFGFHPVMLSVAVWVGFLALFGLAVDDGVVITTYLQQSFAQRPTTTVAGIREATVAAGLRRVRPCLMTSGTTILALLPVLTATGRGADIMLPMALPAFGGMTLALLTMFTAPVLYCWVEELRLRYR